MPDLNPNHVTCPQKRRTRNRRTKKSKLYKTVQWKDSAKEFVAGKVCEWCGSDRKLLPHHPYQDTKDGVYSDLYLSGCIVLCSTCHFMFHRRHKRRCPFCKEGWRRLDTEMCYACYLNAHPGLSDQIAARKEDLKAEDRKKKEVRNAKNRALKRKHPCRYRMVSGRCQLSKIDMRCTYAPSKALGTCGSAEPKKGVKVL